MSSSETVMTVDANQIAKVEAMLPSPPLPLGSYVAVTRVGNLLYTSGVLPMQEGRVAYTGALGGYEATADKGREAARLCVLNALSLVRHELGSLNRVQRVVKVTGFVSSAPDFYEQPAVVNGASDFLVETFGDAGRHVRSAVGVAALPANASVEIEFVFEIKPE
jgi:enamine deaminase RidA (YjgF/YER057c/UK114 family)